jgi:hypothetical protein
VPPGCLDGGVRACREGQQQRHSHCGPNAARSHLLGPGAVSGANPPYPDAPFLRRADPGTAEVAGTGQDEHASGRQRRAETGQPCRGQPVSGNCGPPDKERREYQTKVRTPCPFDRALTRGGGARGFGGSADPARGHRILMLRTHRGMDGRIDVALPAARRDRHRTQRAGPVNAGPCSVRLCSARPRSVRLFHLRICHVRYPPTGAVPRATSGRSRRRRRAPARS